VFLLFNFVSLEPMTLVKDGIKKQKSKVHARFAVL
jgi:hypothetical protein